MIFSYGVGNEVTKVIGGAPGNIRPGTTLRQAIDLLRPTLGCCQNVEGYIGGVAQADSLVLTNEMGRVSIQDRAQAKAVGPIVFTIKVTLNGGGSIPHSADEISDLFCGISGGQVDGDYEVVQ